MKILTVDFETYYDRQYSLSKLTTEEYIRHPNFEVIGVAVKEVEAGKQGTIIDADALAEWCSGDDMAVWSFLKQFDWENSIAVAHNAMFDMAILSWKYKIFPKKIADTLSMARALHGTNVGGSLKVLSEHYDLGQKGDEVVAAIGMHKNSFSSAALAGYAEYCVNDVELTYKLFRAMLKKFPISELDLIDLTIRMFTEPALELDTDVLKGHLKAIKDHKDNLLSSVTGLTRDDLMSNPKFAAILEDLGVSPPRKISPTTGKETYAFAKTDEGFKELLNHDSTTVQAITAARAGVKSTIAETRTERFMQIAARGPLPIPLRYYAAHTGRWGGTDKINMQNLPRNSPLKGAMRAPKGYLVLDCDSSQIEARTLAWLAEQDDLVEAFDKGEDVYRIMAGTIYGKKPDDVSVAERFVGKQTILGCIAEGTPVLCKRGWVPIEQVSVNDMLWDGGEWVCHQGLVPKGTKETLNLCGSWLTPDHKILCGTEWKETQLVVHDENTLCRVLDTGLENLPSQAMSGAYGEALKHLLSSVTATKKNTLWTGITSKISNLLGVTSARRKRQRKNNIGSTHTQCQTIRTVPDYSTGLVQRLPDVITPSARRTSIMGAGVFVYTGNGDRIELNSLPTYKDSVVGIIPHMIWTVKTIMGITLPAIYGLFQKQRTTKTEDRLQNLKRRLPTYDLAYAGPRNRFTIWTDSGPVIAHNCGYGMGHVKFSDQLKAYGVTDVEDSECQRIIEVYRRNYLCIPQLWRECQNALRAIMNDEEMDIGRDGILKVEGKEGIRLPNGFYIRYPNLRIEFNEKDGKKELIYDTKQGRKLTPTRVYGGKVVENVCQALARIIIGEQILMVAKKFKVVMTVHDAITCVIPEEQKDTAMEYVELCMRMRPRWAPDLPLDCEGGIGLSYGTAK